MTTTVQRFGKRRDVLDDHDLCLATRMLVEALAEQPDRYPALKDHGARWDAVSAAHRPGAIALGLEDLESDPAALAEFRTLLDAVEAMVLAFGEAIPLQTVEDRWPVRGLTHVGDVKTRFVLDTIRSLRSLVAD